MSNTPTTQDRKPLAERFPIIAVSLTSKQEVATVGIEQPFLGSGSLTNPPDGKRKYPFRDLKVGEGFYAPVGSRETIITSKKKYQKMTGFLFITRKQPDGRIFVLRVS